jgi:hypothetical protein
MRDEQLQHALRSWIASRVHLAQSNQKYVISESSVFPLAAVVASELASRGIATDGVSRELGHLLKAFLLDERSGRRALIGDVAVDLSPTAVAGGVLGVVGLVQFVIAEILSPVGGTVAVASLLQAAISAVSRLTRDEKDLVELALAALTVDPTKPITAQVLLSLTEDWSGERVAATLADLRSKGAVDWSGEMDDEVRVKRWF